MCPHPLRVLPLGALLLLGGAAQAASCPATSITVSPDASAVAPLNARVRVEVYSEEGKFEGLSFSLRARGGEPVESVARVVGQGQVRFVELAPKKPLSPRTTYEVVRAVAEGQEEVAGVFTTGTARALLPPRWGGTDRATLYNQKAGEPSSAPAGEGGAGTYALLHLKSGTEEDGPERRAGQGQGNMRWYALWMTDKPGSINYAKPPVTYLRQAGRGELLLGESPGPCPSRNFVFPTDRKTLRFGVRVVDLAGHLGRASEVTLELARPGKR